MRLHLVPHVGHLRVQSFKPSHVRELYATLAARYSASLLRQVRTVLRQALQDAVMDEVVPRNAADGVKLPAGRKPDRPRNRALSAGELQAFLAVAAERFERFHGPAFTLMSVTGLRRGELCALTWSAVDFEAGVLRVTENLPVVRGKPTLGSPKSAAGTRVVPLGEDTVALLRAWKARQALHAAALGEGWTERGFVVTTLKGTPLHPDLLTKVAPKLAKLAGTGRVTPHSLRHTNATLLLSRGTPAEVVKAWLGHANVGVTLNVYRHVLEHEHRAHAVGLEELLAQPKNLRLEGRKVA